MSDILKTAADKAAPRRFSGESITGFAPLTPDDCLVCEMERIWSLPHSHECEQQEEAK